jgi:hypothetical protein
MSHTADEFGGGVTASFDTVREESVPSGLFSDVFAYDRGFSPVVGQPPSMLNEFGLYHQSSSDNRSRAATWSDSFMDSSEPVELSDDLAILLKLAGPDDE